MTGRRNQAASKAERFAAAFKKKGYSAEIFYMRKRSKRGKFIAKMYSDSREAGTAFRAPHHTVTRRGMYGPPRFGEVGRAAGGILLLDDLQDWSPVVLRGIREFIEDNDLTVRIVAIVDRDAVDEMSGGRQAIVAKRLKKIEKIFWPSLGPPDEEERTAAPKKKKVPVLPWPRRSTVDIERLPVRKFGSCLRCAICIAYDVNRGCCTVCGRPLSANTKKRAKNPTASNPKPQLARQRRIASSFLRSIR